MLSKLVLCVIAVSMMGSAGAAEQRWLRDGELGLSTDGKVASFSLPNPGSGPTTIALARDGTLWFTESGGNRIGRMNPDGSGLAGIFLAESRQLPAHHRARCRR